MAVLSCRWNSRTLLGSLSNDADHICTWSLARISLTVTRQRLPDAWNRHDAKAYASLFADDGDVVNVVGWWWKGRREIERQLAAAHAVVFRDSRLTIVDVEVRFLARDVAIAHVRWTMEGARTPPSIPEPRQGIQIQVLHKRGAAWRIAAFQNTNSLPEAPFPKEGSSTGRSPQP